MGKTFSTGLLTNGIWQDASNNIGIGAAPSGSYKLEVTGTAKVSSTLLVSGATTFSSSATVSSASTSGFVVNSTNNASYRGFTIQANGTTQAGFEVLPNTGEIRIGGYSTTSDYFPVIYSDGVASLTFGVGATPSATFSGTIFSTAGNNNSVIGSTSASTGWVNLIYGATSGANVALAMENSSGGNRAVGTLAYAGVLSTYTSTALQLGTNNNIRMTITSGGNVGIGTTGFSDVRCAVTGVDTTSSNYVFICKNGGGTNLFNLRNDGFLTTGTAAASPFNNTTASVANTVVFSDGGLGKSTASSKRFKENINEWDGNGLDTILALKPKTFTYKADYYKHPDVVMLGLIAEEVAEVSPYLAEYENEDRTGQVENVRYANIVVPLIAAIQELNERLNKAGL
jgi:hypothetical protein